MKYVDIVCIGGGPSGMAGAISAYENGVKNILILERDSRLGGILNQCIHSGFGLQKFNEELTGPEYSSKYIQKVLDYKIPFLTNTMVIDISKDKIITATNETEGVFFIQAKSIILAMGCRERTRGAINIVGDRPSGIYTAGTAQKYVNIMGLMPGKKVVILGSGDIGLIMARRMTLEGAKVLCVLEVLPYSGGLKRNIVQCLNDFNIPLMLNHTVVKIVGKDRLEGVVIARVDENRKPIEESFEYIECDTLLLSVGLIPENELTKKLEIEMSPLTNGSVVNQYRQTSLPGVFSAGNVLHVHDLVDNVSLEAEIAGKYSAKYVMEKEGQEVEQVLVLNGENVSYVVPQRITLGENEKINLMFRVKKELKGVKLVVRCGDKILAKKSKVKVAPGEMENLTVNLGDIKDNITVECL